MSDKKTEEYRQDTADNQQEIEQAIENASRKEAYEKLYDIVTESFNSKEQEYLNDIMNLIKKALISSQNDPDVESG